MKRYVLSIAPLMTFVRAVQITVVEGGDYQAIESRIMTAGMRIGVKRAYTNMTGWRARPPSWIRKGSDYPS